ncbi:MAG: 16S rRNA processing protein RimM [Bacteroidales bacterium]|nr:16S rRNA processing protein RimM [Bacteroidales bacterium]
MDKSNCYLLGTLRKVHGIKGELILTSDFYLPDDIEKLESVFIEINKGLVPFFISKLIIKNDKSAIIKFDLIDTKPKAKEFLTLNVYTLKNYFPDSDNFSFQYSDFIGYSIIDKKYGEIGEINKILDIPDNPVFQIVKNNNEILIPISDKIINKINHKDRTIFITAPEGLIDLYI